MNVTVTGATGLIGARLVGALRDRGDDVIVLSRRPEAARDGLGVEARLWDPMAGPPPADAIAGRDAVIHLAGENVAQRWSPQASSASVSRASGAGASWPTANTPRHLRTRKPAAARL